MINLITGLPGAGKTLYVVSAIDKLAKQDNRPVFYSGINEVTLPGWTEIDPEKWYECPVGSLILIDECQGIFRPRTISKEPPLFVSKLETHRHLGVDLYMMTQHPMLADSALRRLSGRHVHVVRAFGMQQSMLHEWPSVKDNCDKTAGRVDSMKTRWAYPKDYFGKYKSAEIHTVKRAIPGKVKVLMLALCVIPIAVYMFYKRADERIHPKLVEAKPGTLLPSAAPGQTRVEPTAGFLNPKVDAASYVWNRTARIENFPQTAPRYDELSKPNAVPIPAACVSSAKGCVCYSQQATKINVSNATCIAIVENGYFQDFDAGGQAQNVRPEMVRVSQADPKGNDPRAPQENRVLEQVDSTLGGSSPSRRSPGSLSGYTMARPLSQPTLATTPPNKSGVRTPFPTIESEKMQ